VIFSNLKNQIVYSEQMIIWGQKRPSVPATGGVRNVPAKG